MLAAVVDWGHTLTLTIGQGHGDTTGSDKGDEVKIKTGTDITETDTKNRDKAVENGAINPEKNIVK